MELEGSVALVTGAAAGTGRAIAVRLGTEGAVVVVADIDVGRGGDVVGAIELRGGRASFVRAESRRQTTFGPWSPPPTGSTAARGSWSTTRAAAGTWSRTSRREPGQWGATLDLNLRGAMLATQLSLDAMRRSGGGAVVNVASTSGLGFRPYWSPEYGAAKAGLIRFTSSLAGLRERMNVRVNCVPPDWIETERAQEELARMPPD